MTDRKRHYAGEVRKMKKKNTELDMLHGPLVGNIIRFALPLAASAVLQQLFNAADLAVVGRFSTPQAMAAVGSNTFIISMLVSLFIGLSVGANVVIANLIGSGRRKELHDAVHTVIGLALICGLLLMVLGFFLAPLILRLTGAPEDVMALAVTYLRIYFLGMPAIMLYNFGSALLRGTGDSTRPFFSLTIAGIVNVVLNLLFVVGLRLHVVGVALATVLSNCLSAGLTLRFLTQRQGDFHLDLRAICIKSGYLVAVIQIGLPAGLQGMVFSLSNVVIQSAVNSFGSDCIAGMAAAQNFDFVSYCVINAFAQTAVTFVSQNYGAGNLDRCGKITRTSFLLCLGIDAVVIACMLLGRYRLIRLFTTEPGVIEYAMVRFTRVIVVHFLCATYEISGGALRGMNHSMVPAVISVLGTCAFRLAYTLLFFPAHRSIGTLMLVYPASWILTGIVMNAAYLIIRKRLRASPFAKV